MNNIIILDVDTKSVTSDVKSDEELFLMALSGSVWLYLQEWNWLLTISNSPFSIPIFWDGEKFVDDIGKQILPFTRKGILEHFGYTKESL